MDISDEEETPTQRQEEDDETGEMNSASKIKTTKAPIDFGSDSDSDENIEDDVKNKKNESRGKGEMSMSQRLKENWSSEEESDDEVRSKKKQDLKSKIGIEDNEVSRKRKVEKGGAIEDKILHENYNSRRRVRYQENDELTQLDDHNAEEHKNEYIRNNAEEHKNEYIRNNAEEHKGEYIRSEKTRGGKLISNHGRNSTLAENQENDTDDEIFTDSASPHGIKGPGSTIRNKDEVNDINYVNVNENENNSEIVSKMSFYNRNRMINDSDEDED